MDRAGGVDLWTGGLGRGERKTGAGRTCSIAGLAQARPQRHSALDRWVCAPPDHPAHNPCDEIGGEGEMGHLPEALASFLSRCEVPWRGRSRGVG